MAEVASEGDVEAYEGNADDSAGKKGKKKKLIMMAGGVVLLLVIAAAAYFLLMGSSEPEMAAAGENWESTDNGLTNDVIFLELPDLLVNLDGKGRRETYLKMSISLELPDGKNVESLKTLSPRIVDNFQLYLRELRVSDLRGSAGLARLREELLRRVRAAVEPIEINDVLFREMLVQ